jgi:transposase
MRWVIERTMSWPGGCRGLHCRYERRAGHFLVFTALARSLVCCRGLTG